MNILYLLQRGSCLLPMSGGLGDVAGSLPKALPFNRAS